MNRSRVIRLGAPIFALALFSFAFLQSPHGDAASKSRVWITVDTLELNVAIDGLRSEGTALELTPTFEADGITVAVIADDDVERLSGAMHKYLDKCGGFIAYETESAAIRSAESTFTAPSAESVVSYTIDNQSNVAPMVALAEEPKIKQTILDLSSYDTRRHDQPSGQLSANYIKNKWTALTAGRDDISVDFYTHPSAVTPQPSIIATITGTESPDEIVVLGGHQDSINSSGATLLAPGADDNASGIACLTEALRVIVETGFRPKKTIQFMAYAAEEVGLKGSRDIAAAYQAANKNVLGAFQLDMTNYTSSTTVDIVMITDFTNAAQNQFVRDLIAQYQPQLVIEDGTCGYACSDHASWTEKGFVSSFPHEGQLGPVRTNNTQIHKATDTISVSNNNANHALKFARIAISFAGELAKGSIASQPSRAIADFDGDGKTDVSVFRPSPAPEGTSAQWWILRSGDLSSLGVSFGTHDDILTPSDFTGDGKADVAFFRPSTGEWYVLRSEDSTFYAFPFGAANDIPAPGDFDGDGITDVAVFRPSEATWFILRSSDSNVASVPFGLPEDKPVVGDYDGDGSDDVAVYRPSVNQWWLLRSTEGVIGIQFGAAGDRSAIGDWTGDGKDDVAFFRPSTAEWYVLRSEDSSFYAFPWGAAGDVASPGDYDGDGITDAAVYRNSDSTWYINGSSSGFHAVPFGANGDVPLPSVRSQQ